MSKPILTIQETAALFGVGEKKIRRAIQEGAFETLKLGRTTFVLREPLERQLRSSLEDAGRVSLEALAGPEGAPIGKKS